jgi:hypothetical protein
MKLCRIDSLLNQNSLPSSPEAKCLRRDAHIMNLKIPAALPLLEKGQLWKTEKAHVEIVEVGKTLTHYRLFDTQKRVPTSFGRIQMVQDYLKNNGGKLIKPGRPAKA